MGVFRVKGHPFSLTYRLGGLIYESPHIVNILSMPFPTLAAVHGAFILTTIPREMLNKMLNAIDVDFDNKNTVANMRFFYYFCNLKI